MVDDTIWHMYLDDQGQLLYYAERPSYSFSRTSNKGKKIFQKDPIWWPIQIEFPTRPIVVFEKWIITPTAKNVLLTYSLSKRVVEKYSLEGATIDHVISKQSRVLGVPVLIGTIRYKFSHRA